jgi:small-conductance mechanosensitive channel
MTKAKPSKLHGIRIELQQHERDLLEQDILLRSSSKLAGSIFHSLTQMPPQNMYAWLTVLEAFGLVDTPIPTLGDLDEYVNAIKTWADDRKRRKEEEKQMNQAARDAEAVRQREEASSNQNYVPTGATPNYNPPGTPDTSDTDYTDPMNRYPTS